MTGLDYYNARYYDPVAGVFLSVDSVQGNAKGFDPYSYTGGNPETRTDPTGQMFIPHANSGGQELTPQVWASDADAYVHHTALTLAKSGLPPMLYLSIYHPRTYTLMSTTFPSSVPGEMHYEASEVTQQIEGVSPKDRNFAAKYNHGIAEQILGEQVSQAMGGGGAPKNGEEAGGGGGVSLTDGVENVTDNEGGFFDGSNAKRQYAEIPDKLMDTYLGITPADKAQYLGSAQEASQYNFCIDDAGDVFLVQKGVTINNNTLPQASSEGKVMFIGDVYDFATS